jgi:multiple sugar transport system substrate-binding protein
MKKLLFVIGLIALVAAVSFAAGSNAITVWLGSWWQNAVPDIQARFAKDNPGYSVTIQLQPVNNYLENATTAILGGTPPDALDLDTLMTPTPVAKHLLLPLDDFMKRYNINASDFFPALLVCGQSGGKTYAIPDRLAVSTLFYNKNLFDQAGVAYPTANTTWEQFLDIARKLTVAGKQYGWGIAATNADPANVMTSFVPPLFTFGGQILNDSMTKGAMSSPATIKAIKYYVDLYRTYKVVPEGTPNYTITRDLIPMLQGGTLAMCPMGDSNLLPTVKAFDKNGWKWGVTLLPGGGHSRAGGWVMTIPATTKNVDTAERFIAWFVKPENLALQNMVMPGTPGSKGKGLWSDPVWNTWWQVGQTAKPLPPSPHWTEIQNMIVIDLQKGLQGTMTPEQIGADLDSQINALLQ